MTVVAEILAETGLDLANPKLIDDPSGLAQMFADRVSVAFPFPNELVEMASSVMRSPLVSAAKNVLAVYSAALSAVQAAASVLEGRLDDNISENFKHIENQRNETVKKFLKPGHWSVVVPAGGPPVGEADLYDNVGGWQAEDFRQQYNPGIVWMSKRTAKSDILLPTWPSPPYTTGYGFAAADPKPLNSPITGFMADPTPMVRVPKGWQKGKFVSGQPACAPIPEKYAADYYGTMPSVSPAELAQLQGPIEGRMKALQRIIQKMDEAFYKQAFVPPPDYWYVFSVGTYPYTSWYTGDHAGAGSYVTFNGAMAAMAMAIHSLTPMHAAIDDRQVAQCYRAWLAASRLRFLPPLPNKQIDDRVYVDGFGLPYALNPRTLMRFVSAKRPENPQVAELPLGLEWSYQIPVEVVRAVELSFRSFFRIRRAAIYQMALTTTAFQDAARASADPVLRSAALGKPPPYKPWRAEDPLGDGWRPGVVAGEAGFVRPPAGFVLPQRGALGEAVVGLGIAGVAAYGLHRLSRR